MDYYTQSETEILKKVINQKKNILIAGVTGTGKTSILRQLQAEVPIHRKKVSFDFSMQNVEPFDLNTVCHGEADHVFLDEMFSFNIDIINDLFLGMIGTQKSWIFNFYAHSVTQALQTFVKLIQREPYLCMHPSLISALVAEHLDYVIFCNRPFRGKRAFDVYRVVRYDEFSGTFVFEEIFKHELIM